MLLTKFQKQKYLLGIPEINFNGLSTLTALKGLILTLVSLLRTKSNVAILKY